MCVSVCLEQIRGTSLQSSSTEREADLFSIWTSTCSGQEASVFLFLEADTKSAIRLDGHFAVHKKNVRLGGTISSNGTLAMSGINLMNCGHPHPSQLSVLP